METIHLMKSPLRNKKFRVIIDNHKIDFGASGYEDFITYNLKYGKRVADIHKERYIIRHQAREDWNDIYTEGFWSRWLLWNKRTINQSIKNIEKALNVKIIKI